MCNSWSMLTMWQTLNPDKLKWQPFVRKKIFVLRHFCFDKKSPNFVVCATDRQTPCRRMYMRYEVNGTLENNRALAAHSKARICTPAYVYEQLTADRLVDLNGTVSFSNSLLLLHSYTAVRKHVRQAEINFQLELVRRVYVTSHQASFHS